MRAAIEQAQYQSAHQSETPKSGTDYMFFRASEAANERTEAAAKKQGVEARQSTLFRRREHAMSCSN
jgi:hypothetical protein